MSDDDAQMLPSTDLESLERDLKPKMEAVLLPAQAGEATTNPARKTRVGFDIDEVLVRCRVKYDYRPARESYELLPLWRVFEALVLDPEFEVFVVTGRTPGTVPADVTEWVNAMYPGGQCTLACREWDHPMDRLTAADRVHKSRAGRLVCETLFDDFLDKYRPWKAEIVNNLSLDLYFDDDDVRNPGMHARALARQFCHVF